DTTAYELPYGVSKHLPCTRVRQNNASQGVDTDDRLGRRFQQGNQQLFGFMEDARDIGERRSVWREMAGIVDHGRSFRPRPSLARSARRHLRIGARNISQKIPPQRG